MKSLDWFTLNFWWLYHIKFIEWDTAFIFTLRSKLAKCYQPWMEKTLVNFQNMTIQDSVFVSFYFKSPPLLSQKKDHSVYMQIFFQQHANKWRQSALLFKKTGVVKCQEKQQYRLLKCFVLSHSINIHSSGVNLQLKIIVIL